MRRGLSKQVARAGAAGLFAVLALAAPAAVADAEKGKAAIERGDFKTAMRELERDAKGGDVDAMFLLSRFHAEGKAGKVDAKAAFTWMERAAKAGSVRAQGSLAMYLSEGVGTPKDDARSLEWAARAAEGGDLISQFIMGVRYQNGVGVARDEDKAIAWWRKASERGFIRAQVMLANVLAARAAAADTKPEAAAEMRTEAARWLIIADAERLPGAEKLLPALKEKMSADELRAAETQAGEWKPPAPAN